MNGSVFGNSRSCRIGENKAVKFPKETTPICHHGESIIEVEQISVTEKQSERERERDRDREG